MFQAERSYHTKGKRIDHDYLIENQNDQTDQFVI